MTKLSISVLSANFTRLGLDCREVLNAGADMIHFDVMDGHFVNNISFGIPVLASLKKEFPQVYFDVHLMITHPLQYIEAFVKAGASCITFHIEAQSDIAKTIAAIKSFGCNAGVAINPDTPIDSVYPYLNDLDLILVMGVTPGYGGQPFKDEVLDKIRLLSEECKKQDVNPFVSVDGGVKLETTAPRCVEAGANLLVSGSAIFAASDRAAAIKAFRAL